MKRTFTLLSIAVVIIFSTSAFIYKSASGYAGYTGSPGEQTCTGGGACHGGGSSASKGVTITAHPSFTLDQYQLDTVYTISVTVGADGFSKFGFGCEILDTTDANAGTMQTPGPGVKFMNSGARKNATHNQPKTGTGQVTFTFKWKAPTSPDIQKATIYVCGNAVNLNNTTTGDIPMPTSLVLTAAPEPPDLTGLRQHNKGFSKLVVYPNPAEDWTNLAYDLSEPAVVRAELITITGKTVKVFFSEQQAAGAHEQMLSLNGVASGIYFIKTSVGDRSSQKLITVR